MPRIPAPRPLLSALALSLLAGAAPAQLRLDKDGGAVPGTSTFDVTGATPQNPLFLLFSDVEQPTTLVPGVDLAIDLRFLQVCSEIPLFWKLADANGAASFPIPVGPEPLLEGMRLGFQAFEFAPFDEVSNLSRLSFQAPETFLPTRDATQIPILTGAAFVQPEGDVLLVGGSGPVVHRYDPDLEEFSIAGLVPSGNVLATQTQLLDGRILVTGGLGLSGQPVADAFVFDPATGLSTAVGPMAAARAGHAAARLDDGRVLLVGGAESFDFTDLQAFLDGVLATSEIFDPATGQLSAGPSLLEKKLFHSATKLSNGQVLVAGGLSVLPVVNLPTVSFLAQSFDPRSGAFGLPALMGTPRMLHGAVALDDGRALLAGGLSVDFSVFLQTGNLQDLIVGSLDSAVTYRPGFFGGFSSAGTLQRPRLVPAMAALPGARALVAGGFELGIDLNAPSFVLEPAAESDFLEAGALRPTGGLLSPRVGAVAVALPEGKVLVAGGGPIASELYQPR